MANARAERSAPKNVLRKIEREASTRSLVRAARKAESGSSKATAREQEHVGRRHAGLGSRISLAGCCVVLGVLSSTACQQAPSVDDLSDSGDASSDGGVDDSGDGGGTSSDGGDVSELQISDSEVLNVFTSQQASGYCYRIPSVVRSGDYIAVLAQRRQGYSPDAVSGATDKRPFRLEKDKLQNVFACADESLISIAMKVAKVERDPSTQFLLSPSKLKWSQEIVLVDANKLMRAALTPGAPAFEPALYDYSLRLQNNRFAYPTGYLACSFDTQDSDCAYLKRCSLGTEPNPSKECKALKDRNMFERYLFDEYAVTDAAGWLSNPDNAIKLLNLRFGSQGAAGFVADGKSWVGLTGIVAYPTVPHAAHNTYLDGEIRMKLGALRVDLDTVWANYGPSTPPKPGGVFLEVEDPALDWHFDFNESVQSQSLRFVDDWRSTEVGAAAVVTFDQRLAAKLADMPTYGLKETTGLDATVDMPGSFDELLRLLHPSAYMDDPLAAAALAPPSERDLRLHTRSWIQALRIVYADNAMFPDMDRSDEAVSYLDSLPAAGSPTWTYENILEAHTQLNIPTDKNSGNATQKRRLANVMAVYVRLLNTRGNHASRLLQSAGLFDSDPAGVRLDRLFLRSARVGPGNTLVLPGKNRVYLPMAGGFPISIDYLFRDIDASYDDSSILLGTERAVAILGKGPAADDYSLFMTLRYSNVAVAKVDSTSGRLLPFNLASWTRDLSASNNSGRTWSGDSILPPDQFECIGAPDGRGSDSICSKYVENERLKIMVSPLEGGQYLVENQPDKGFKSTQVQASLTSIPGFFGAGKSLVLHVHPATATEAILEGVAEPRPCLGEAPGDATKADSSRCDFRYNLQVTPGSPSAKPFALATGAAAVEWAFAQKKVIHAGSAGYSSAVYLGRNSCSAGSIAVAYEGTPAKELFEYRGFNNGINLQFVLASGGDYRHLGQCEQNLDVPVDF
jgi:hypothetical protein